MVELRDRYQGAYRTVLKEGMADGSVREGIDEHLCRPRTSLSLLNSVCELVPTGRREWAPASPLVLEGITSAEGIAALRAAERRPGRPLMRTYEVFLRRAGKEGFAHAGSLDAPDDELALVLAREAYVRRGEGDEMWLVDRAHVLVGGATS